MTEPARGFRPRDLSEGKTQPGEIWLAIPVEEKGYNPESIRKTLARNADSGSKMLRFS